MLNRRGFGWCNGGIQSSNKHAEKGKHLKFKGNFTFNLTPICSLSSLARPRRQPSVLILGAPQLPSSTSVIGGANESESIIAALLAVAASGAISHVTTARAWTGAEFKVVAEKASKAASHYRAPGKS
jgi:hypothetical protein